MTEVATEIPVLTTHCKFCGGRLRAMKKVRGPRHTHHSKCYKEAMIWEEAKRTMEEEKEQGIVREFPKVVLANIMKDQMGHGAYNQLYGG